MPERALNPLDPAPPDVRVELAVCVPADGALLGTMRRLVSGALEPLGVTPACIDAVRLGLSEACTNAIEHAGSGDDYEVRMRVDQRRCELLVIDTGKGFDAATLVAPDPQSPRGRGVAIMRAVMDHVEVEEGPHGGNAVRLVKHLDFRAPPIR